MNLTIDTCSLINLSNDSFEKDYLLNLEALNRSGQIKLIIPRIIVDEWNHHKEDKVFKSRLNSFRTKIKHARSVSKILDDSEKYHFVDLINKIERLTPNIENEANKSIRLVDEMLSSPNTTILETNDNLKIIASNWAIEKLPPFGEKNSMKDALIFLTVIEYLKENSNSPNYFVSNNFTDFATKSEKDFFSQNLKEYADSVNLKFYQNIPLFMREVEHIEIEIAEESVQAGIQYDREELIKRLKATHICHQCGESVKFSWLRSFSVPGLSLHVICPSCRYDIDTLEFWD